MLTFLAPFLKIVSNFENFAENWGLTQFQRKVRQFQRKVIPDHCLNLKAHVTLVFNNQSQLEFQSAPEVRISSNH
jgi:hypothetical protein